MPKQILLRRLNKDGLFEKLTQSNAYKVELHVNEVAYGISNFALACVQEGRRSKGIVGLGDFEPKRIRDKNPLMNTARVCVLGVYITLYGEHKINIGQLVADFKEKTGCFNDSINSFNRLFEHPVHKNVRVAERHTSGRLAMAYFWVGLNAVADLIKETYKMRAIGLFEKEILLREYLIQLGITQLNVFNMLEGRKNSENEVLYFWMSEHQTTLNFSMRGNNIYINRSIQHLSTPYANPSAREKNVATAHGLPIFMGDGDVTLDAVVTERPSKPKARMDKKIQSGLISAVNDHTHLESLNTGNSLVDERQNAGYEIIDRDAQIGGSRADKVIEKEAVNDITNEQSSPILEIAEKFDEYKSPVKDNISQDNGIVVDNIEANTPNNATVNKTIVPQRPRVPITANTNNSPISNMGGAVVVEHKNSDDAEPQAKVKKPMFKGIGKSPINFDML